MKTIPLIVPVLLVSAALAHSQDAAKPSLRESDPAARRSTTPRILGEIPDGTPPPAAPSRPAYRVSEREILATITHRQGGRTITMRQIRPIELPLPPAPVQPAAREADTEFRQRAAEYREVHPESNMLLLGATVYRFKDGRARTLVRYWPRNGRDEISMWTSADFSLIAGGINSFEDTNGTIHHLLIGWGVVDSDATAEVRNTEGNETTAGDIPEFAEGKATFQIMGSQPPAEDLAPILALHEIYNNELARLKTAYERRERARTEREEYLKANPPQPQDITLNFWRTEKPAPNRNGGDK